MNNCYKSVTLYNDEESHRFNTVREAAYWLVQEGKAASYASASGRIFRILGTEIGIGYGYRIRGEIGKPTLTLEQAIEGLRRAIVEEKG